MKRIICTIIVLLVISGCGGVSLFQNPPDVKLGTEIAAPAPTAKPKVDLPPPVEKPDIKVVIIKQDGKIYIGYSVGDALKLYEYMVKQDARADKLEYRIKLLEE